MQGIVERILENAGVHAASESPRQIFYRQFDAALHRAEQGQSRESLEEDLAKLEDFGRSARIAPGEIAYRAKTLLWTLAKAS